MSAYLFSNHVITNFMNYRDPSMLHIHHFSKTCIPTMVVHYKEVDAPPIPIGDTSFPTWFWAPSKHQDLKLSRNVQHGSSGEAFESHQIVFKTKCVFETQTWTWRFRVPSILKKAKHGSRWYNKPLEVIKSFSKSDEMHWKHKVELGCFKATFEWMPWDSSPNNSKVIHPSN